MRSEQTKQASSFYNAPDPDAEFDSGRLGRSEMQTEFELVSEWLRRRGFKDPHVVEIGCGKGPLRGTHARYIGLDISFVGLATFDGGRINASAEALPFRDHSVSFLFSFAALEHVPNPELAFEEIVRVLRPGGLALIAPAWFCRDWAAKGLPVKKYSQLPLRDRIAKALIPLRNSMPWRLAWVLPKRLLRELRYALSRRATPFTYRRLQPNLEEYVYTDCDAFTSMDPHVAILFFQSRGMKVIDRDAFGSRMRVRNEPLFVTR